MDAPPALTRPVQVTLPMPGAPSAFIVMNPFPKYGTVLSETQTPTVAAVNSTEAGTDSPTSSSSDTSYQRPVAEFLFHLTRMLTEPSHRSLIEWEMESIKEGRGGRIRVHDPHRLESEILSRYFRHSKYSSFQRQLNYFGFRKIVMGPGKGRMSPCLYINNETTDDLSSLLLIKRKISNKSIRDSEDSKGTEDLKSNKKRKTEEAGHKKSGGNVSKNPKIRSDQIVSPAKNAKNEKPIPMQPAPILVTTGDVGPPGTVQIYPTAALSSVISAPLSFLPHQSSLYQVTLPTNIRNQALTTLKEPLLIAPKEAQIKSCCEELYLPNLAPQISPKILREVQTIPIKSGFPTPDVSNWSHIPNPMLPLSHLGSALLSSVAMPCPYIALSQSATEAIDASIKVETEKEGFYCPDLTFGFSASLGFTAKEEHGNCTEPFLVRGLPSSDTLFPAINGESRERISGSCWSPSSSLVNLAMLPVL